MDYRTHLSKDKKMALIVKSLPAVTIEKRNKVYLRLCSSILSQQLNVRVAHTLHNRFIDLYKEKEPTARQILNTPVETFQSIGFSKNKSLYIHNVCHFFLENKITDQQLDLMENEEVINLLTQIKGVGRWTVEMILMFTLGREDIFALDDLGIRNAMIRLYDLRIKDKKKLDKKLLSISDPWSPYRTYACRYLWMSKDMGIVVN